MKYLKIFEEFTSSLIGSKNYQLVPENIKKEAREYLLDKLGNLKLKLNEPGYLEGCDDKNWMFYYSNDGKIVLVDDVDSNDKMEGTGKSSLLIKNALLNDFESLKGDEYFEGIGNSIPTSKEIFSGYLRELVGEIVTELYDRKFDEVNYGLD